METPWKRWTAVRTKLSRCRYLPSAVADLDVLFHGLVEPGGGSEVEDSDLQDIRMPTTTAVEESGSFGNVVIDLDADEVVISQLWMHSTMHLKLFEATSISSD